MAEVLISNVKKSYGEVVALHDISLEVPSGSFFTLLGPSGCGKTTLLRTIAGFHHQDSGSISVAGRILDHTPVYQRDVGMVFQDYAIFPHLSVRKNIAFGLKLRKVSKSDSQRRVEEILDVVQLGHLADRMPHELSGGQQQRVGLARSLVTRPQVLLMDEPLSNLDAQLRIDLRAELRAIQQELGITTIYVTHDQEEALEMSDHVCVMHAGIIQQSDTPWNIYRQPANQFVASFVGSNNFLSVSSSGQRLSVCGVTINPALVSPDVLHQTKAVAAIRPEHVHLRLPSHQPAELSDYVQVPVTLTHRSFVGRELRMTAKTADNSVIHFISEPRSAHLELPMGAELSLYVHRNSVSFYSADGDGRRL